MVCATGRIGSRCGCSRRGRASLAALGAFLVTVWAIYGCTADPLYGITTLARGVAELAAFADTRRARRFFSAISTCTAARPSSRCCSWSSRRCRSSPRSRSARRCCSAAHRRDWRRMAPLVGAAAIVASVIPSTINIGLRHILPAFPLLAIVAAIGLGRLLARPLLSAPQRCRGRAAAGLADRRGGRRRARLSELFQPARARASRSAS